MLKPNSITVHQKTLALQIWCLSKVRTVWVVSGNYLKILGFFRKCLLKAHYCPAYYIYRSRLI